MCQAEQDSTSIRLGCHGRPELDRRPISRPSLTSIQDVQLDPVPAIGHSEMQLKVGGAQENAVGLQWNVYVAWER